jgi:DNA-binding LacI/PurR family transcriptional regulator
VKRLTITDIAERAGVSTGAVSYALNDRPGVSTETRRRILDVAAEMGWRPSAAARALSASRAAAVGLVLARDASTLGVEPFFMRFIAGLQKELSTQRTALLLQVVDDHDAALTAIRSWWAEQRVDGVIVTDLWTHDSRLPAMEELGIPAVLVGRPRQASAYPAVWSDDVSGIDQIIDYLVELGHRRIARVAGLPDLDHTHVRTEAFRVAATRHGLDSASVVDTDYTWEAGAQATEGLLSGRSRPTAIVYDNDIMALAGLSVARKLRVSVPSRLSIVAGDDSQLCEISYPRLTALSRDVHEYGVVAARTLNTLIAAGSAASLQAGTPKLLPRDSTAAPRPAASRPVARTH